MSIRFRRLSLHCPYDRVSHAMADLATSTLGSLLITYLKTALAYTHSAFAPSQLSTLRTVEFQWP